jgi:hypothetical protein
MKTNWKRCILARVLPAALCLSLTALAGCGPPARAIVSGKVTFANQPLTVGTVTFYAADNIMGSGVIKPDGTYTVADAPVGDVTVLVVTPKNLGPTMAGRPDKPAAGGPGMPAEFRPPGADQGTVAVKIVPIPEKYGSAESSPLKFSVQKGTQTYEIELMP